MLDASSFYVTFLVNKVIAGLVFVSVLRVFPCQYYSPNASLLILFFSHLTLMIYRVIQEKESIFLEVIVSTIVEKKQLYEHVSISDWLLR